MEQLLEVETLPAISDDILESAVIYEVNIRQYSREGTFQAFTKDIPQLKELGVKIIWVMPIFPISKVKRKATGDVFADDIKDLKKREKYLGSYYAVSNFRAVNPEFGTIDDFRTMLRTAHENDIYIILDWVPNHTGWDHVWIKEHPEFYTKNAAGEITEPLKEDGTPVGWADVADLNYENEKLQQTMIADMLYWVNEENIDGFRCDMAGMVPKSFWEKAIPELRDEKNIFMLAEWESPDLMEGELFEMSYAWEGHHLINAIAKGEKSVKDFDDYMTRVDDQWAANDILMYFLTNHDENSWAGTVHERLGEAADTMLALIYTIPGMPLIYSGQEYDLDHRLKFFEKDEIPKKKGKVWPQLVKMGTLKNSVPALEGGKNAASYERLSSTDNENVLAFRRKKGESEVVFVANMTKNSNTFNIEFEGEYTNALTGDLVKHTQYIEHDFDPWEYKIFIK